MSKNALLLCLCLLLPLPLTAADYDLLIRNARIIDGTGNPWFRADVAIRSGKIAAIGRLGEATADRVIDAGDRVVAPGFIDIHTHVEPRFLEKGADDSIPDGVTTIVAGNCGSSQADLGVFFATVEKFGMSVNLASLIGHNAIRREVMGIENRKATPEEIARMQALIEKAMSDGAYGFSTGLVYQPGRFADAAEVIALSRAAAKHGGLYATHMRDEGVGLLKSIEESALVGRETGMRVQISHLKVDGKESWGLSSKALELVRELRSQGLDITVDQYPYDSFTRRLQQLLPPTAFADNTRQQLRIGDPAIRSQVAREMERELLKDPYYLFDSMTVVSFPPSPDYEGKSIREIARAMGRPDAIAGDIQTIFDLVLAGDPWVAIHAFGEMDVQRILSYSNTAVASDGRKGTHAHVLSEYVRNRRLISLEDAIRKMTSLPALIMGFHDRGLIKEGFNADLVMFDPKNVQDNPALYPNPKSSEPSKGFDLVLVNGVGVVDMGKPTGARSGKVLRSNQR